MEIREEIAESIDSELRRLIEHLGNPKCVTLEMLSNGCEELNLFPYFRERGCAIPKVLHSMGFERADNPHMSNGAWRIGGRKIYVYAKSGLERGEIFEAIKQLKRSCDGLNRGY